MMITDPKMLEKMQKALRLGGGLHNLSDISDGLKSGHMQGHVEGDTWAITQIHQWPRRKSVNIIYVIGSLENSIKLEAKIEAWAKEIGANYVTAVGRDGWWEHRVSGWAKVGTLYAKDI